MKKKIILKRVFHRGRWRILISFDYDQGFSVLIRQVENSRYSNTYKSWYVDDDEAVLKQVFAIFRDKAEIDISYLAKEPVKSVETGLYYDEVTKEFLLPWSVLTVDSMSDYFSSRDVEVIVTRTAPTDALKSARKELGEEIRSHR
jgi:hypothetical protein